MGFFDIFKDPIGIDPGSQHLRIIRNGEIVFNELAQISFNKSNNSVSGLGNLIGFTENDITVKPVDYAIADFVGFEELLREAMKRLAKSNSILPKSYKMYYCIPINSSQVEMRAYRDSGEHSGASEVYMIYQSCCAAIGLNILLDKKHFILIDFGYSKIEITIFVNSVPVSVGLARMGTSKIYNLLKNHLKRTYEMRVTDKEVDSILAELKNNKGEIKIHDTIIKVSEIEVLLNNFFVLINDTFRETMEQLSGHADIQKVISAGVYFTGGGSAIDFLREKITLENEMKSTVSPNPALDNSNGLKKIIADSDRYKEYLMV